MFKGRPTKRTATIAVASAMLVVALQAAPAVSTDSLPAGLASVLASAGNRVAYLYDSTRALVGLVQLVRMPVARPVSAPAPELQLGAGELLKCQGTPAASDVEPGTPVNKS